MNAKMKPEEFCALRKRFGLSQARVAMRVGTSRQCVHYYETGKVKRPEWPVSLAEKWIAEIASRRGLV